MVRLYQGETHEVRIEHTRHASDARAVSYVGVVFGSANLINPPTIGDFITKPHGDGYVTFSGFVRGGEDIFEVSGPIVEFQIVEGRDDQFNLYLDGQQVQPQDLVTMTGGDQEPTAGCPPGTEFDQYAGACLPTCAEGEVWDPATGECVTPDSGPPPGGCPDGFVWDAEFVACLPECPSGQLWDPGTNECVTVDTGPSPPEDGCPEGTEWDSDQGACLPTGDGGNGGPVDPTENKAALAVIGISAAGAAAKYLS